MITAADFIDFKVTDKPSQCAGCFPNVPKATPVVINGKQYCVWCALGIAEKLLSPDGKTRLDRVIEVLSR
ncbi:MAG TPA: hypothetical protein VKR59_10975 [Terriglobales bacterium]|nr:hypothetical protein [Terriglobales bacterium]